MRKKKSRIPRSNKRWREFLRQHNLATENQLIKSKLANLGIDIDLRETPDSDSEDGGSPDVSPKEGL